MFDWLFTKKYEDDEELVEYVNHDNIDVKNTVKWIIRNSEYEIYNDMFFNTQQDACKYVNLLIKNKQANQYTSFSVETYCVDHNDNSTELDTNDDILEYIENNDVNIIIYKLYKKNNLLFRITMQQFDDVFYVTPIKEFILSDSNLLESESGNESDTESGNESNNE